MPASPDTWPDHAPRIAPARSLIGAGPDSEGTPVPGRGPATLREVHAATPFDPAATLFVAAALAEAERGTVPLPVLWVQDRLSRLECGSVSETGLRARTGLRAPILRARVNAPRDVLWTMEEAAGCAALGAVVGEIHGDPKVLDFTATKRLALRAEAAKVPLWLIRTSAARDLSAARERWSIASAPSDPHPFDPEAPGDPVWRAEMFRARGRPPGQWTARLTARESENKTGSRNGRAAHDGETDRVDLAAAAGDGPLAARPGRGPHAP